MIKAVHFKNFKALRDTTLELGRFTLLIGPNGSGKSTVIQALEWLGDKGGRASATAGVGRPDSVLVVVSVDMQGSPGRTVRREKCQPGREALTTATRGGTPETDRSLSQLLNGLRAYSFHADRMCEPVELRENLELGRDGFGLAGVMDTLRDHDPERFEALNGELGRWLPEFDRVLFDTPRKGHRAFALRTRQGGHRIRAEDLSQGTLFATAILTLAYLPEPPPVICLEEPDHGLHPRLLQDVRDAIYRLCHPESFGEQRPPVQVVATTDSPYMLDLFREHPEEVVICRKTEDNVLFQRLSDLPELDEILRDTRLGDAWYTGILGGVPTP